MSNNVPKSWELFTAHLLNTLGANVRISMAFRKRNIAVGRTVTDTSSSSAVHKDFPLGVKPSSLTSHGVISTGTRSLDSLLGGHGGLALGSSLMFEESGTTDFAGALLRYFAAQGVCHGQVIHVVGVGEGWVRNLPGVAEEKPTAGRSVSSGDEKMKIAWRYERLGQANERVLSDRNDPTLATMEPSEPPFSQTFDLSKRLPIPQDAKINHIPVSSGPRPFDNIIIQLEQSLKTSSTQNIIHRLIIPTILSPAIYPPQASQPENFLRFLHSLRALLRQYVNTLTAMITLPLELYPRSSGLTRWAEILSDGVLALTPFPHLMDEVGDLTSLAESGGARSKEEQPQGLVKVHKLPVNTERGEGGAGKGNSMGEDLAFTVSRRKFVIKPFFLPPLDDGGDQQQGREKNGGEKLTRKDVEF